MVPRPKKQVDYYAQPADEITVLPPTSARLEGEDRLRIPELVAMARVGADVKPEDLGGADHDAVVRRADEAVGFPPRHPAGWEPNDWEATARG